MNKFKFIILITIALIAASCSQFDAIEYENDPAIYFANEQNGQRDSLNHSFFIVPGDGPDTVYLDIRTMGYLSNIDRTIKIIQTNAGDENAAIAGVHYVPFDDPKVSKYFIIPANSAKMNVPIILLRDESLNLKQVRLELAVAENENFRPGIERWRNFVIKTTAQATKPTKWDSRWKYHFGASWGSVKMKFIIDHTGYTEWDIVPSDYGYLTFLRSKVLDAFQQYNQNNPDNPLKEADGTLVSFTS